MNVTELDTFTLLHVATRGDPAVAWSALSARLGIDGNGNAGQVATRGDGLAVLWFGAGRWLVHAPASGFRLDAIEGAAITELTDSRRIFALEGTGGCDYLSSSCPLDLSDTNLLPGSCALTQFDRFSILLHRLSSESFRLYVERSYAPSLRLPAY